jgi:non-ribosomal peptide synthase protein (TIGR01720 family)
LLLVAHHLVVDSFSWRILLDDLQTAYQQALAGMEIVLPPKTHSFQLWSERLGQYAQLERVTAETPIWHAVLNGMQPLPLDYPHRPNLEESARAITAKLSADETDELLRELPAAYGADVQVALLSALAEVVAGWTQRRFVFVELEGHGREDLFEGVDISRTVGWFTTIYPVRFNLEKVDTPHQVLLAVKEQLRSIPARGFGYGLLRYLRQTDPGVDSLSGQQVPEISFNYLGQFDNLQSLSAIFRPARENSGPQRSLRGNRTHVLSVTAIILNGHLQVEWNYSATLHRKETIELLAEKFDQILRLIIAHCHTPGAVGYTPSDFPDVELSQDEIEALLDEIGEV